MTRRTSTTGLALVALLTLATAGAHADPKGVTRAFMNPSVSPCEDFFKYANGGWADTAQIPASYTGISTGREVFDRNQELLRSAIEAAAANVANEKDATVRKVGILYATLMDSARADREGWEPIKPLLAQMDGIKTKADVTKAFATLTAMGINAPWNLGDEADFKNSTMTLAQLNQSGLGMPERDYYFRPDEKSVAIRNAYVAYAQKMFEMTGRTPEQAQQDAAKVLALETALAESSLTRVQLRDIEGNYHNVSVADLQAMAPGLDWAATFKAAGLPTLAKPAGRLNLVSPSFVRQVSNLVQKTPVDDWRAYLHFVVVRSSSGWLSQAFVDERFKYVSMLTGQKQPSPRWKRSVQAVDGALGEAVGKTYVAKAFSPEAMTRMKEMVDNLQAALSERIAGLDWMSADTKAAAQKKLAAVTKKVGYPDKWRDYSALEVDAKGSAVTNLWHASSFGQRRSWNKFDKPVDRGEWAISPATVNAYYNPTFNEIVFPAGILQPPYFDVAADDAMNYGGIGAVIGHEMTHGFDDEGRKFDAQGNMKMWWTDEDDRKFTDKAKVVSSQYDTYVAVDTLHVNGKLTLGENIADIGGLKIAYEAYQKFLAKHGRQDIDGFTPEQRFFLAFAQNCWRNKNRPEATRSQVLTDPHSPNYWRVNGALSNSLEFRKAFGCKDGDRMVQPETTRAQIW